MSELKGRTVVMKKRNRQMGRSTPNPATTVKASRWWKKPTYEAWQYLLQDLSSLQRETDNRHLTFARFLSLYTQRRIGDFRAGGHVLNIQDEYKRAMRDYDLVLNPAENCVAALAARIASQRPRPRVLTDTKGPEAYKFRQRAEGLEKLISGVWGTQRVYRKAPNIFIDAAVMGFGAMKVYGCDGEIRFERVFPAEIVVDEAAAISSEPRVMMHVMYIPSEVLKAEFPGHAGAIEDQAGKETQWATTNDRVITTDLVKVVEGWHLRSSSKTNDGRRIIAIDGQTLLMEEWTKKRFPFSFFRWSEPLIGWYPAGLVEMHEPLQRFVNKMMIRFQSALHLHAVTKTYYEEGSLDPQKIRNQTGDMVAVTPGSQMPKTDMPGSMSSEAFRFSEWCYNKIFESTGVSMLSAAGVKPPGIEAAVALRQLEEKEAGRHSLTNLNYEDFFLDLADLTIDTAKDLNADGNFKAWYQQREGVEQINLKDVDMERDQFQLSIFPTSLLPYTPAGRLAAVEEMLNAGFIDKQQALALLDAPDIEQFTSLETASLEDIDRQIEEMLGEGKTVEPEPFQDLELALSRVTSALIRSRTQGAPEERQKLLLDYIRRASGLLQPPPPPAPPPGEMMPPGPLPGEPGMLPGGPEMPEPIPGPQADIPMATPAVPLE
jgi:hypothetical protein